MGIKYFFKWFSKNFSKYIQSIQKTDDFSELKVNIDTFMIDMNGIFHTASQKVYGYGDYKTNVRLIKKFKQPSNHLQIKVFETVCETINLLFKIVQPRKRLVLCVDGPAPLSKQNQ